MGLFICSPAASTPGTSSARARPVALIRVLSHTHETCLRAVTERMKCPILQGYDQGGKGSGGPPWVPLEPPHRAGLVVTNPPAALKHSNECLSVLYQKHRAPESHSFHFHSAQRGQTSLNCKLALVLQNDSMRTPLQVGRPHTQSSHRWSSGFH